ncbi:3D domain-containing protein [Pricia sp.]|uniref:3D domain-containing protein n=1 Tax=Pricia sp. TaxID=2268138 RepID=UPI00359337E6
MIRIYPLFILFPLLFVSCAEEKKYIWKSRVVKVSAYNSTIAQTDGLPTLAAWSDTLVPGMKAIAVSRDLIALGLDHNTPVKIEGLDGVFLVKDKMASRMRNKIDIYMGNDIEKAREWGTKTLKIQFRIQKDTTKTTETTE